MRYYVEKQNGQWHILDAEGYGVSYVSYDTKREAQDAARALATDAEADLVRAHKAGIAYARRADSTRDGADTIAAGLDSITAQEAFLAGYVMESKRARTMESVARRVLDGQW